MSKYPEELERLLARNSETEDFVLSYPFEKDKLREVDLENIDFETVPLFMQWDKRWGYKKYSGEFAALSACGPVCLSMAAVYTLENTAFHPAYMIDFAIRNGYSTFGSGSLHSLIYEGGEKLGLKIQSLPLEKNALLSRLKKKNAVVCLMGPGDFTKKGHFVVCAAEKDGKIKVNDPNSIALSQRLWDAHSFISQARRAWAVIKYE